MRDSVLDWVGGATGGGGDVDGAWFCIAVTRSLRSGARCRTIEGKQVEVEASAKRQATAPRMEAGQVGDRPAFRAGGRGLPFPAPSRPPSPPPQPRTDPPRSPPKPPGRG